MKLTQQYGEAGHAMPFQGIVSNIYPYQTVFCQDNVITNVILSGSRKKALNDIKM